MGVTWNGPRRGPKRVFAASKNTPNYGGLRIHVSPPGVMKGSHIFSALLPPGKQIQKMQHTHFHRHLDFYWSICMLRMERTSKEQIQNTFCIFPVISTTKQRTIDDILRICAVCRFIGFARSTVSIHKCIQTCQFVSSFYVPSCELAHNRLIECVQLICPFV